MTTEADRQIIDIADSLESLLFRYLIILGHRSQLLGLNRELEDITKRAALALIAMRFIDRDRLDGAFELGMELPTLPKWGFGDLLGTCNDIRNLQAYATRGKGADSGVKLTPVSVTVTGNEPAPAWQIDWDEYEETAERV